MEFENDAWHRWRRDQQVFDAKPQSREGANKFRSQTGMLELTQSPLGMMLIGMAEGVVVSV